MRNGLKIEGNLTQFIYLSLHSVFHIATHEIKKLATEKSSPVFSIFRSTTWATKNFSPKRNKNLVSQVHQWLTMTIGRLYHRRLEHSIRFMTRRFEIPNLTFLQSHAKTMFFLSPHEIFSRRYCCFGGENNLLHFRFLSSAYFYRLRINRSLALVIVKSWKDGAREA